MNCIGIQSMIAGFVNDELNIKELELFLDHVINCPNCKEEVEIYYTLLTAMKQLDEDKSLSSDYKHDLEMKLNEAQEKIVHAKYTYYRKKAVLILIITAIAFTFNLSYTTFDMADTVNFVTESNFEIKRAYKSEGLYKLERRLQKYIENNKDDLILDDMTKDDLANDELNVDDTENNEQLDKRQLV